jgi:hypothetical protein
LQLFLRATSYGRNEQQRLCRGRPLQKRLATDPDLQPVIQPRNIKQSGRTFRLHDSALLKAERTSKISLSCRFPLERTADGTVG